MRKHTFEARSVIQLRQRHIQRGAKQPPELIARMRVILRRSKRCFAWKLPRISTRESDVMTGGKPCNLCISLNCASIFCKWRMRSECADFDQNAPGYFSFVSVYSTCLRTSGLGSNFISFNLSGLMRLFFVVV